MRLPLAPLALIVGLTSCSGPSPPAPAAAPGDASVSPAPPVAATPVPPDPMNRTDDLPSGSRRAPAHTFPNLDQINRACGDAIIHQASDEMRRWPGLSIDPTIYGYSVRNPQCRWEEGSAATAVCRFEATMIGDSPTPEQRAAAVARTHPSDWHAGEARLILVGNAAGSYWVAPAGCTQRPQAVSGE